MSEDPRPARPLAGAVIGGMLLGLMLAFFYFVFAFSVGYGLDPDGSSAVLGIVLLAVPVVVGVLLLVLPGTRRSGSGFVIGLAVGLIILPGVCTLPLLGG